MAAPHRRFASGSAALDVQHSRRTDSRFAFLACSVLLAASAGAGDWPMWRYDAGRCGVSPEELSAPLHLQWFLELPEPRPAWPPTQTKLQFDAAYEPVVAGKLLFVPSMVRDSLTAYDTATGKARWRFYADGPVRFAPVAHEGRVYFVSDDGFLYCLRAGDGKLLWRFRGGPSARAVLGNGRLISTWPARGAPVLTDGTLYFAAGIWPFMGIFRYALDPDTGKVLWENSGSGSVYVVQQHGAPSFAGVAPQGYLAAAGGHLLVAGGRTVPAVYNRHTGRFLYFHVGSRAFGKSAGGYGVMVRGEWFFNRGPMYHLADGRPLARAGAEVVDANTFYAIRRAKKGRRLVAYHLSPDEKHVQKKNRKGEPVKDKEGRPVMLTVHQLRERWSAKLEGEVDRLIIKAGSRLYGTGEDGLVAAIEMPDGEGEARVAWQTRVPGDVANLLAADGKLFVVTRQGAIYCFGAKPAGVSLPAGPHTLVPKGATWKYLDDGSDPGTAWRAPDFDDAAWAAGPAELGYGDGDEATVVSYGPDKKKKHIATYFRHAFTAPAKARYEDLRLNVLVDDGAIVYLNGEEACRLFMPEGVVRPTTLAKGGAAEGRANAVTIAPGLLVPGRNVLAVEVHQGSARSSDISFSLALSGHLAPDQKPAPARRASSWTRQARSILERTGITEGWCLVLGLGRGRLAEELARESKLHVVVIESDGAKVLATRRRLDAAGLYGSRVAIVQGEAASYPFPPYFASLVVAESLEALGAEGKRLAAGALYRPLRPYGGTLAVPVRWRQREEFARWAIAEDLPGAQVRFAGSLGLLTRRGALAGSADWTHQYADAANSVVSADLRVRLPLGLLWFGGTSHEGILPRHGHGPSPQVVGGRLFIEGADKLRAADVYTGRLLWERALKGFGTYYNKTSHFQGAGGIGSNYVSLPDGIYAAHGRKCLRLDPATGKTLAEFALPPLGREKAPYWGYLAVYGDVLIATGEPDMPAEWKPPKKKGSEKSKGQEELEKLPEFRYAQGGWFLAALDRHTGKVLWRRAAARNFRHNAIAVGSGKVFCIDGLSARRLEQLRRRGITPVTKPRLYALDVRTGDLVWMTERGVFGTWLGYSVEHDVLVQATSRYRDRAPDEAEKGIAAYRGADGTALWAKPELAYGGPPILHGDTVITQATGRAFDLLTGQPLTRRHPLTGQPLEWTWSRMYGCNTASAARHLLLFRSGAAGYFDLTGDGGTGNLGGFRAGCTSNLIAANGIINAPDYTRTCACAYQNQTSLAMVHDPGVETWTFNTMRWDKKAPVRRLGLNFGAPGDRRGPGGTLWLDWPSVGGPSPDVPVDIEPAAAREATFRLHSSRIAAGPLRWVAASGIEGARGLRITLAADNKLRRYTVRLVFAEPRPAHTSTRRFSVVLNGATVLDDFDVAKAAGGARRAVVKEFRGIPVINELKVALTPSPGSKAPPLLCGIELLAED